MQPEDIERAQDAARNYINKQMQAADVVSVASLDSSLSLDQDFTQDKSLLLNAVNSYSGDQTQGFAPGSTSTTNQVEDTTAYTADESEYNDINTDRELFAIAAIAKSLNYINQKKALLYFSGGISRDGIENQASLRSAINSAVRSNMSIYSVDARGLQAISPLATPAPEASAAPAPTTAPRLQNNLDANFNSQEVMANLSSDTGGKAFFDSNDFAPAFQRMQQDMSAYYVIGFRSTDARRDGSYRRLSIKINRSDLKLEYRPGYYAPADYKHSTKKTASASSETSSPPISPQPTSPSTCRRSTSASTTSTTPSPSPSSSPARRSPSSKAATATRPRSTSSAKSKTPPAASSATRATP